MMQARTGEFSWVPSHFRVCMEEAARPREDKKLEKLIPEEVLYFPKSLKAQAALSISKNNVPINALPEELKALVKSIDVGDSVWDCKRRTCAQEDVKGAINIGNFNQFPQALLEAQPTPGLLYHTNLIDQARLVMDFLVSHTADKSLMQESVLSRVLQNRYPKFLELLANSYPVLLAPPKDVALVWFSHMLQSDSYRVYIKKNFPVLKDLSHSCLWPKEEFSLAEQRSEKIYGEKANAFLGSYRNFIPNALSLASPNLKEKQIPKLSPADVIADYNWITQFLQATSHVGDRNSEAFLRRSLLGYQRFMFLMAKWTNKMEHVGFAPCPPIDLMWHTHLIQPSEYRRFSTLLLNSVHHHKLLNDFERTQMSYSRSNNSEQLWRSEFGESQAFYLTDVNRDKTPLPSEVFDKFACDSCVTPIPSGSIRYHCQICPALNLCEKCQSQKKFASKSHLTTHVTFPLYCH